MLYTSFSSPLSRPVSLSPSFTSLSTLSMFPTLPSYSQLDLAADPPEYCPRAQYGSPQPIEIQSTSSMPPSLPNSSSSEYIYHSKYAMLNLGPRIWGTAFPAYGQASTIQGFLDVMDAKSIQSVTAILEGFIKASMKRGRLMERSVKLPRTNIVNKGSTLFMPSSPLTSNGLRIPFTLPIIMSHTHPPTFGFSQSGLNITVTYQLQIDIAREGWGRDEKLVIPILYLPKSAPTAYNHRVPSLPGSVDWKSRERNDCFEYEAFELQRTNLEGLSDNYSELTAKLHLPKPLEYTAHDPIPFRLTLTKTTPLACSSSESHGFVLSLIDKHQLERNLIVELYKVVSIGLSGSFVRRDIPLGCGVVSQVSADFQPDPVTPPVVRAQGMITGGKEGGEMSWAVSRGPLCAYEVRASLQAPSIGSSSPNGPSTSTKTSCNILRSCSVTIRLRTNFREDLMLSGVPTTMAEDPALGLLDNQTNDELGQ